MARMALNRAIMGVDRIARFPAFSLDIRNCGDSATRSAAEEPIREVSRSVDGANRFVDELRQRLASRSSEIKTLLFPKRT